MARIVIACICLSALAWSAGGASGASEAGRTQLGILGDAARFTQLTGQRSTIRHCGNGSPGRARVALGPNWAKAPMSTLSGLSRYRKDSVWIDVDAHKFS